MERGLGEGCTCTWELGMSFFNMGYSLKYILHIDDDF
jgi:hypothetical protein